MKTQMLSVWGSEPGAANEDFLTLWSEDRAQLTTDRGRQTPGSGLRRPRLHFLPVLRG